MKRSVFFLVLLLAGVVCLEAKTYYIPHIHTDNDTWETYLILDNMSRTTTEVEVRLISPSYAVPAVEFEVALEGYESRTVSLREYRRGAGFVEVNGELVRVRVGYKASASSGGGVAEFDAPDKLETELLMSLSEYDEELTWAGFAIFNPSPDTVYIHTDIYLRDGTKEAGPFMSVQGYARYAAFFQAQFGYDFQEIASVVFRAATGPGLAGILISGHENEKLLFTPGRNAGYDWVKQLETSDPSGMDCELGAFCDMVYNGYTCSMVNYHPDDVEEKYSDFFQMDRDSGRTYAGSRNVLEGIRVLGALALGNDQICLYGEAEDQYFIGNYLIPGKRFIWKKNLGTYPQGAYYERVPEIRRITAAMGPQQVGVYFTGEDLQLNMMILNKATGAVLSSAILNKEHLLGDAFRTNATTYGFGVFYTERHPDPWSGHARLVLYKHTDNDVNNSRTGFIDLEDLDSETNALDLPDRSILQRGVLIHKHDIFFGFQICSFSRITALVYEGNYRGPVPATLGFGWIDPYADPIQYEIRSLGQPVPFGSVMCLAEAPFVNNDNDLMMLVSSRSGSSHQTTILPLQYQIYPQGYEIATPIRVLSSFLTISSIYAGKTRFARERTEYPAGGLLSDGVKKLEVGRKSIWDLLSE